jgi:molybdate transport system substrate-binding protein
MNFRSILSAVAIAACVMGSTTMSMAATLEVFHADSLAGPLGAVKKAFEAKHPGTTIKLTGGTSRALADRILAGEHCDVFAPSSSAIANELVTKNAAPWSIVFSANEMVVITAKGNPKSIKQVSDLAKPGVTFTRITGEKDLGTGRTVEFIKRATTSEGHADLAQKIVDAAPADPAKPQSVPMTVSAVKDGKADAGVVYYSAAVAAKNDIEIVRFPANVNLSEAIQNAANVPGTAKSPKEATDLVAFLLSAEGRDILLQTGQPPVVPPIRKGNVPPELAN